MTGTEIVVEFGGGLESIIINQEKKIKIIFEKNEVTCRDVIERVASEFIVGDKKIFCIPESMDIRPGVLVLINDSDWELVGKLEASIKSGDNVAFISTLHGG